MAQQLAKTSFARQPLDVVLSRGGAIRVLRALLQHGEPLSVTRIASDTRLTPGGVRAVLDELVETRIVRVVGSGRTQLYYIPGENPFARPLEALFRAETARLSEMLKQVAATAEKAAGGKLTVSGSSTPPTMGQSFSRCFASSERRGQRQWTTTTIISTMRMELRIALSIVISTMRKAAGPMPMDVVASRSSRAWIGVGDGRVS
jgi:DNA-binding transcriptional ArsR family regulator